MVSGSPTLMMGMSKAHILQMFSNSPSSLMVPLSSHFPIMKISNAPSMSNRDRSIGISKGRKLIWSSFTSLILRMSRHFPLPANIQSPSNLLMSPRTALRFALRRRKYHSGFLPRGIFLAGFGRLF